MHLSADTTAVQLSDFFAMLGASADQRQRRLAHLGYRIHKNLNKTPCPSFQIRKHRCLPREKKGIHDIPLTLGEAGKHCRFGKGSVHHSPSR